MNSPFGNLPPIEINGWTLVRGALFGLLIVAVAFAAYVMMPGVDWGAA